MGVDGGPVRGQPPSRLFARLRWQRDDSIVMKQPVLICASVLLAAACTSTHTSPTPATRTTTPSAKLATSSTVTTHESPAAIGQPGCKPPSPINRGAGFPEVEGTSNQVQFWGLIMVDGPDNPVRVNEQVKIVWRITGSGQLRLTSVAPDGETHPLQWGPDLHLSSSYRRPGQEWGAGYQFTRPGCWDLHAIRGNATADVWLNIAS